MKIIAFTKGKAVPSSRFRIRLLIDKLATKGFVIKAHDAFKSSYPPAGRFFDRLIWLIKEVLFRVPQVFKSYRYDAVILQREMISTLPTLEIFTKRPRILDVDDAIWLHRKGIAANTIAKHVDHIVCGNQYLANYFSKFNKSLTVIPTGVDADRFMPIKSTNTNVAGRKKIIGWSGSSSGFKYLYEIESELQKVLAENPDWVLRIVSNEAPCFTLPSATQYEFIKWSEDNEVITIQEMDIGIMPLDDSPWSCGKCSYKMLLYMACGVPVVVSDFGMNSEVLSHKFVGLGVKEQEDWCTNLTRLVNDESLRAKAGLNGREVVLNHYSIDVVTEKWIEVLSNFKSGNAWDGV